VRVMVSTFVLNLGFGCIQGAVWLANANANGNEIRLRCKCQRCIRIHVLFGSRST